jgi:hypothetical protein
LQQFTTLVLSETSFWRSAETGHQNSFVWGELAFLFECKFIASSGVPQGKYWPTAQPKDEGLYVMLLMVNKVTVTAVTVQQFRRFLQLAPNKQRTWI